MKFGNHTLQKAENVKIGDRVCFELDSASYVVDEISSTKIGMIIHHHGSGSNSYWPNELVYVEDDDITQYYKDRANSGLAALAR